MIEESLSKLRHLESFERDAFLGDQEYNQDLCNFILALSLIWNDTKNLMLILEYIRSLQPKEIVIEKAEEMPITPFWGEISGLKIYIEKLFVALIHELFELIRNSNEVIESKCFNNILKQLPINGRNSWEILVQYAYGDANTKTPLGKAFLMVRHKIANHYDKDEIFKGYKRKFYDNKNIPYISRGTNMLEQRFYFADASAQEYYITHREKVSLEEFYQNLNLIKEVINSSIKHLVETFIQRRSAWKKV